MKSLKRKPLALEIGPAQRALKSLGYTGCWSSHPGCTPTAQAEREAQQDANDQGDAPVGDRGCADEGGGGGEGNLLNILEGRAANATACYGTACSASRIDPHDSNAAAHGH